MQRKCRQNFLHIAANSNRTNYATTFSNREPTTITTDEDIATIIYKFSENFFLKVLGIELGNALSVSFATVK